MPLAMARSLWGAMIRLRSAKSEVGVCRVARSTICLPGLRSLLSSTRPNSTGCASAMLLPHISSTSHSSRSSKQPNGSSLPKLLMKPVTALAMQSRALASTLLLPMPARNHLEAA